jgi:hypothetical protein
MRWCTCVFTYLCNSGADHGDIKYEADSKSRNTESTSPPNVEVLGRYRAPLIRLEKQPGYVDIVYASEGKPENNPKAEKLEQAPVEDPRAYGLAEIVKVSEVHWHKSKENIF